MWVPEIEHRLPGLPAITFTYLAISLALYLTHKPEPLAEPGAGQLAPMTLAPFPLHYDGSGA